MTKFLITIALILSSSAYSKTTNDLDNQSTRTITDEQLGAHSEENQGNVERYHRENTRPACPTVMGISGALAGGLASGSTGTGGAIGVIGSKIGERFCDH